MNSRSGEVPKDSDELPAGEAPAQDEEPRADDELLRQLDAAETQEAPVEAVFVVRPGPGAAVGADRMDETVQHLLERAEVESGGHVLQVNVFRYLSSFAVRAEAKLIRNLINQPEIAGGVANRQAEPLQPEPDTRRAPE